MNTDIQRIKNIIESETGVNLDANTRKRSVVHARRMYYKILKLHTNMSLDAIGKTLKTKMFDLDYEQDKVFNSTFRKIINLCNGIVEQTEEEKLKDQNLIMKYEIRNLNKQIDKLNGKIIQLKNDIKELMPKTIHPRNQQTKIYHCTEGISENIY
jgi:hypothetical protein